VTVVGYIFLAVIAIGVLMGLVLLVAAMPDIARYRRIRRM
jgi:hypothetical protein